MARKFVMSDTKRVVLEAAARGELWCWIDSRTQRESWVIKDDNALSSERAIAWQTVYSLLRAVPPLIEAPTPEGRRNCRHAQLTDAGMAMLPLLII